MVIVPALTITSVPMNSAEPPKVSGLLSDTQPKPSPSTSPWARKLRTPKMGWRMLTASCASNVRSTGWSKMIGALT